MWSLGVSILEMANRVHPYSEYNSYQVNTDLEYDWVDNEQGV